MVSKCGKMAQNMMGNGKEIRPTDKVHLYMLTAIFMKGSGSMIKHMGMGHTSMRMGRLMLVNGTKTSNTELASKSGRMVLNMRDSIRMARSMETDV
jgi:hypothetical protein